MDTPFFKRFSFILATIVLTHFTLVITDVIPGNIREALAVDLVLAIIFSVGIIIILPSFKDQAESFALRFLAITTLQMLAMLSLVLILIVGEVPDMRYWAFSSISLFVALLTVQSILFIKEVNKKKK